MVKIETNTADDKIIPLYMNGLVGRMLRMQARKKPKRELLLVYGHHASLERMWGVAEELSRYGNVTVPDLPGFGGMQSFYKIGEQPTLDNLADYLAAFIKLRYKSKRITLFGMSFGFLIITRMLQRYPELAKKVDMVVSIVGFAHYEDFKFNRRTFLFLQYCAWFFSHRLPAAFVRHILLRKIFIRAAYNLVADRHSKLKDADANERKKRIEFEIGLWHSNDVRTYMKTGYEMLTVDLFGERVALPVYHVTVEGDRYFDNQRVEQHLKVIYDKVKVVVATLPAHAPTVIADAAAAAPLIPAEIRKILR